MLVPSRCRTEQTRTTKDEPLEAPTMQRTPSCFAAAVNAWLTLLPCALEKDTRPRAGPPLRELTDGGHMSDRVKAAGIWSKRLWANSFGNPRYQILPCAHFL